MLTRLPKATIRTRVELPMRFADGYATDARVFTFDGLVDDRQHLAFALGDRTAPDPAYERRVPLIRPHSACLTGDAFGSQRCDCGPQLREAVERIAAAGGYLLYLRQEGRGIGLYSKLDAYALQDTGIDTYEANQALGVSRVALLSNNPDKARQLRSCGVTVVEQVPTGVYVSAANHRYLETKARRGRHTLELPSVLRSRSSDARLAEPGAAALP